MEGLWFLSILAVQLLVLAAHRTSSGLTCTTDFVNNVSCSWRYPGPACGEDCWVSGAKTFYNPRTQQKEHITRSCSLKRHGNSPPSCSFVFENKTFFSLESMPHISVRCGGQLMENITRYSPVKHIRMHPPGTPAVSSTSNGTQITWTPGAPVSYLLKSSLQFEVQIRQSSQSWRNATTSFVFVQELKVAAGRLTGELQVRVRVMPHERSGSQWSHWSPTTTWVEATDPEDTPSIPDQPPVPISLIVAGITLCLCVNAVLILTFYKCCKSRGFLRGKPVPNPSKYFQTLQTIHGGNLKNWLNPESLPESFFTVQPCEEIQPVEVCTDCDAVPSPSPSLTSIIFNFPSSPSSGPNTGCIVYNSSSMSNFSNMGYFMSSCCSSSIQSPRSPAYFTYEEGFQHLPSSRDLTLSLCLPLTSCPSYESLKREPVSPDSGFGIERENEQNDLGHADKEDVFSERRSPALTHPAHLPSSFPPAPLNPPTIVQTFSSSLQVDVDEDEAAASESSASRLVTGGVCRSSSMPLEPGKTGYLTLKELHTTFSNKSF